MSECQQQHHHHHHQIGGGEGCVWYPDLWRKTTTHVFGVLTTSLYSGSEMDTRSPYTSFCALACSSAILFLLHCMWAKDVEPICHV
jgi:hypothetical protein